MAETVRDRINRYIEDCIAAERNFEDALHTFGSTGVQPRVKTLLDSAGDKAKTQHERLTALLQQRGGTPSGAKSALAHMLAFTPLTAQLGHSPAEKNTQHLLVTYAAAAAEQAMYESLIQAAEAAGEEEVLSLARQLQSEERADAEQVWPLIRPSSRDAFNREIADGKEPISIIRSYLEDIIAAEESFETQLTAFSKEGDYAPAQQAFSEHAKETREQYEQLTVRLKAISGSPSIVKSFLAHMFNFAPKTAQVGHDAVERVTQNLMMGYAVENAEVAMYEAFCEACTAAGDLESERIARTIQQQERATAEKVWSLLGPIARRSVTDLSIARAS
jgi:ferritin-like metal-binding protein YciE